MFSKLLRAFCSKVFIGINLDSDVCQIHIVRIKSNKIKQNIKTEIKIGGTGFPMEAFKLIHFYRKKYPFTYIGILSKTINQGAIPEVKKENFLKFGINYKKLNIMSFQNTWSAYIDEDECSRLANQITELGTLDCLFSPFIPIFMQAQKNKNITLYVLQEKNTIGVAITNCEALYYGKFFFLQDYTIKNATISQDTQDVKTYNGILDNLNLDLDDLENLDDLDDLDEEDLQEEFDLQEENKRLEELNDFMRATTIVDIIEQCIQEYYGNQNLQSTFIEKIIILDTYGITSDSLRHIRETLLIDVEIQSFSIPQGITSLLIKEFKRGTL